MSTILLHMAWLSANLECRSEICCTRLTGNTGCKNDAKSCHLRTIAQLCQLSSPLRHVSTIGKNLLNSNISCRCPHNMANFGPLTAVIGWRVWGTPTNFNGFHVLASLLQRNCSLEANQTLHDLWPSPALVHYTMSYTFSGALVPPPRCKIHFASKSCILLYWQRYCTALQQLGQPNFAVWYKEWNYGTFAGGATYIRLGGHRIGHRRTF